MIETPVAVMPQTFQTVSIFFWGGGVLAMLVYSIVKYNQDKTLYPLFVLIGSLIAIPYEAVNNLLGHCLHPQTGQIVAVNVLDRPIPVWTMLAYSWYFAIPVVLIIEFMLKKGRFTPRKWWIAYAVSVLGAFLVELVFVKLGVWTYYGSNQPVKLFGTVPLWWGFVNGSSILSLTILVYLLHSHILKGAREWIFLPVLPMLVFIVHGAPSLPAWFAISSSMNKAVTNLGALGSVLLSLLVVWIGVLILNSQEDKS